MITELNKKYLITTDDWFLAPDGNTYKAVFGTLRGIQEDEDTLGIKGSTNWYVNIGNMLIAGCQVHYAIQTDAVNYQPPSRDVECEGFLFAQSESSSRIYNADEKT